MELEEKTSKKVVNGQNFLKSKIQKKDKVKHTIKKVTTSDDGVDIKTPESVIYELMGSVNIPNKYKNMDVDEMIEKAKMDYFKKKI